MATEKLTSEMETIHQFEAMNIPTELACTRVYAATHFTDQQKSLEWLFPNLASQLVVTDPLFWRLQ